MLHNQPDTESLEKQSGKGDPGEYLTPLTIKQGTDSVTRENYWKLLYLFKDEMKIRLNQLSLDFIWCSEYLIMKHEKAGWKSFKYSFCCIK